MKRNKEKEKQRKTATNKKTSTNKKPSNPGAGQRANAYYTHNIIGVNPQTVNLYPGNPGKFTQARRGANERA
jgi:hypothetical protein